MYEWIVAKVSEWDLEAENNKFLDYLNSFGQEKMYYAQIRTGIILSNLHLTPEEKRKCLDIIIEEYQKCNCLQDLDALINKLLTKPNRNDLENYIIYHLENLYNDSLTLNKEEDLIQNSEKEGMILARSLYLASQSLPCSE